MGKYNRGNKFPVFVVSEFFIIINIKLSIWTCI